ncbi:hypothetical protein NG895_04205 [Aeoliella sp. ICT_H6.2]|uniref:Phage integrase family protein n=1 Tax=Aeoliella straminimaris TaxID=2954799 RepID=A0A9X2FB45_9BACT|nr:hypothetical protein [Aeoliella straminimaris]MCO6043099.1 hypothetical protein [Aeoliella straminimaris]
MNESDLWKIREILATTKRGERVSPVSLKRWLTHTRTLLRTHHTVEECDALKSPPAREIRKQRYTKRRHFTREECLQLLDTDGVLRSMVLLGLNCGFGPADCQQLTPDEIQDGWLKTVRPKTGQPRLAPLWPETVDALTFPMWDRFRVNKAVRLIVPGVGFYGLRRTFCTIASASDAPEWAIAAIMGHVGTDIRSLHYREQTYSRSLRLATDFVRGWLDGSVILD